ncbi:hypothetical protein ACPEEZ_02860 [Frigoribacterium sp. 2-23]|uniref:hypothetical protein n=1 Tax=Frigoribacterium sp. 2-23 TaxID=3415006 RepID=UPI003C6EF1C0
MTPAVAAAAPAALSPFVHPFGNLALTIAVLLVVATAAFTVPVLISSRRVQKADAITWADDVRADPGATWAVDRLLRVLWAACARENVTFPGLLRVVVGLDSVVVDLATPAVAPPRPWRASGDGRTWTADTADLQEEGLAEGAGDRFATVVAVGSSDTGRVLVDLHSLHGALAIDGDRAARLAVTRRLADQLVSSPWSRGAAVVRVGLGDDELGVGASLSLSDALGVVIANTGPGLLVLSDRPSSSAWLMLRQALERPGSRWGVVLLGRDRDVRWQLTAHRDGTLASDHLGPLRWVDVPLTGWTPPAVPGVVVAGLADREADDLGPLDAGAPAPGPATPAPVVTGSAPR